MLDVRRRLLVGSPTHTDQRNGPARRYSAGSVDEDRQEVIDMRDRTPEVRPGWSA